MPVNPEVKPVTDAIIDAIRAEWDIAATPCRCSLRARLVGDGCATCNPDRARDLSEPSVEASAAPECDEKPAVPFTRKAEHVAKLAELATDAVAFLAALKTEFELLDGIALDFDDDDDELIDGFLVSPRQVSDAAVALDVVKATLADHREDFAPLVNPNDC